MKITTLSVALCLAASTALADKKSTLKPIDNAVGKRADPGVQNAVQDRPLAQSKHHHKEHYIEAHRDGKSKSSNRNNQKGDHRSKDDQDEEKEEKEKGCNEEKEEGSKGKKAGGAGKQSGNAKKSDEELLKDGKEQGIGNGKSDNKKSGDSKNTSVKEPQVRSSVGSGVKNSNVATPGAADPGSAAPTDSTSPLWLAQPYGASLGPNPDPIFAEAIKPKTPVDIRLMQGPPESLREVAVLKAAVDSNLHSFQWTVPVAKAGDPRSNKNNVGEPLQMSQKGDLPQHTTKGPLIKPAAPPNPIPADNKPAAPKPAVNSPPVAAKPVGHTSAAVEGSHRSANMLGIALTLFGAVYLL
ncbi:hypothetical protein BGX34_000494 [Mortierella sp. NVP85]|nr:hypothetical protein BGX34_000494 [Mortierella sp. NVP85]